MGAYFGSKLSPHIMKNPAGFLICKDVAIARLGTQKYLGREIGVNDRPNDIITVYRTEEEKDLIVYERKGEKLIPLTETNNPFIEYLK